MTTTVRATVRLASPAHEMAREEILKQVAYLSREISSPRFAPDATTSSTMAAIALNRRGAFAMVRR